MGQLGNFYHDEYAYGNRDVIAALEAEEANLLHAWRLARQHEWWGPLAGTMQGLQVLYDQTGRRLEWRRLVEEIVPDFVDPATGGPLPGRNDDWGVGDPTTAFTWRGKCAIGVRRSDFSESASAGHAASRRRWCPDWKANPA